MSNKVARLSIPSSPDKLCLVRSLVREIAGQAGCDGELTERLVLAVNEACMNVMQHAFKGAQSGEIRVEILNNGTQLVFRLEDNANPVDLATIRSRPLDEIRPGGLGVHFISEIMDEFTLGHLEAGTGNFLEMKKAI